MTKEIPCPHATLARSDVLATLPDYHPLQFSDVVAILEEASALPGDKNFASRASALQIRLNQGIPGITCPRAITGRAADAQAALDDFYVNVFLKHRSGGGLAPEDAARIICGIYSRVEGRRQMKGGRSSLRLH